MCTRSSVPTKVSASLARWVEALCASAADRADSCEKLVKRCVQVLLDLTQNHSELIAEHQERLFEAVAKVVSKGSCPERTISLCFDYLASLASTTQGRNLIGDRAVEICTGSAFPILYVSISN